MNTLTKLSMATAGAVVLALGTSTANQANASTITFSETQLSGTGFNGQTNPYLISSDGEYRVEAFWLNTSGHFHTFAGTERNHNNSRGSASSTQGIRITRVDNAAFDLLSMGLFGQAAIGNFSNFITGAGSFDLFSNNTGSLLNPGNIAFGSSFANLTSVVLADPGRAGGTSFVNSWDNINLQRAGQTSQPIPEPASVLGIMAFGALGGGKLLKRKRQQKQAALSE